MKLHHDFEALQRWGWASFFQSQLSAEEYDSEIARVISVSQDIFKVQVSDSEALTARVAGKLRLSSETSGLWPSVGDWVVIRRDENDDLCIIEKVLDRKTSLSRKVAGQRFDRQILSANFDWVLIASSVNQDFNIRRLERYVALAWDSGAVPVILLTKSDLVDDIQPFVEELPLHCAGVEVYGLSLKNPDSLLAIKKFFERGMSSVIVGSSGVGKSSLVNALIGQEILETFEIRDSDGRGRHTSTSRQLMRTLWGGLIIDTPGMRELQLLDHQEGVARHFEDINFLSKACRFGDCQHQSEPGCQILRALKEGELLLERWESFQKLQREMAHLRSKQDKAFASQRKNIWKKRTMQNRAKNKRLS